MRGVMISERDHGLVRVTFSGNEGPSSLRVSLVAMVEGTKTMILFLYNLFSSM